MRHRKTACFQALVSGPSFCSNVAPASCKFVVPLVGRSSLQVRKRCCACVGQADVCLVGCGKCAGCLQISWQLQAFNASPEAKKCNRKLHFYVGSQANSFVWFPDNWTLASHWGTSVWSCLGSPDLKMRQTSNYSPNYCQELSLSVSWISLLLCCVRVHCNTRCNTFYNTPRNVVFCSFLWFPMEKRSILF